MVDYSTNIQELLIIKSKTITLTFKALYQFFTDTAVLIIPLHIQKKKKKGKKTEKPIR